MGQNSGQGIRNGAPKCKSIHELSTVWSFTQTWDFAVVRLIGIKQVIIPVKRNKKKFVKSRLNLSMITISSFSFHGRVTWGKRSYVSSSPAFTFVLAMRTIRLSPLPTLMILAQQLGVHCKKMSFKNFQHHHQINYEGFRKE